MTFEVIPALVAGFVATVVIAIPMMPAVHPRMATAPAVGTPETGGGTATRSKPGFFGANWGGMTPVGPLISHLVYGLVLALVYSALV